MSVCRPVHDLLCPPLPLPEPWPGTRNAIIPQACSESFTLFLREDEFTNLQNCGAFASDAYVSACTVLYERFRSPKPIIDPMLSRRFVFM